MKPWLTKKELDALRAIRRELSLSNDKLTIHEEIYYRYDERRITPELERLVEKGALHIAKGGGSVGIMVTKEVLPLIGVKG